MLAMKKLKTTRAVTYRRYGIPALIIEGRWLTEKYRLRIGDTVDINYQPNEIRLTKNVPLSRERQIKLKEKEQIRLQRMQEFKNANTSTNASPRTRSAEVSEG